MRVGIIGLGYVGTACYELFKDYFTLNTFDINKKSTVSSVKELSEKSDIIFLCLPTPMKKNGSCDLSIIESTLTELNDYNLSHTIVIKSTVQVGTTDKFSNQYSNLSFVFNPEFLTEANFIEDFKNQDRIIIGSNSDDSANIIEKLYREIYSNSEVKIRKTNAINAELVKYITNTFLSVKVSFANEIHNFAEQVGADYKESIELAMLDSRLGNSHWMVPGPDGKKGYGGSCFPKDINALLHSFDLHNLESFILKASWERNILKDRPEKDWEKLEGRAVSKQKE